MFLTGNLKPFPGLTVTVKMRQCEILLILRGVFAKGHREQTKYTVEYEHKKQYVPLQEVLNIELDYERTVR